MKLVISLVLFFSLTNAFAVTWTYQVNINNGQGKIQKLGTLRSAFDAGPYGCEVTPVFVSKNTEYRTLICGVGSSTVSTGGLCTRKGAKFSSVQYAILNMNSPKNSVNVVVACKFD